MTGPTPEVRRQVIARDLSKCQWCGRHVRTESGWYSLQHRRARGMGGSRDAATNQAGNLVLVCGTGTTECHGEIEGNPAQAIARGFRIAAGATPSRVPIVDWTGREWILNDDGGKTSVPTGPEIYRRARQLAEQDGREVWSQVPELYTRRAKEELGEPTTRPPTYSSTPPENSLPAAGAAVLEALRRSTK
ncbi:HNH endonuclease [Arthrobacter phage TaylorSipht]|nr:HNH endonuclease [Arthrobacter phage TaylorSipht]